MLRAAPPTDQRAGVRPIAFALDVGGILGSPVTLKVRPEDLTRTEPSRIAVHQTLGREVAGWVDNFGRGLPSVTIAGHTGWRASSTSGEDGIKAFERLNRLVQHEYHAAKQLAIDTGINPATVKLLFVDMLDNFTWNVAPTSFVLRRSKSRPLLMQYNIQLQAVSIDIDNPFRVVPFLGDLAGGIAALSRIVTVLRAMSGSIQGWVAAAVAFKDRALAPIANTVSAFAALSLQVYDAVYSAVASVNNGISSYANSLISIAADLARVGRNIFYTFAAIQSIPQHLKYALSRVASAYNEVICIFSNSLRPSQIYQDYDGLYGASNCSSTTGGRSPSPYLSNNTFAAIQPQRGPVTMSGPAQSSITSLGQMDPVLEPVALPEIDAALRNINGGTRLNVAAA